jgi:hypothetical protein
MAAELTSKEGTSDRRTLISAIVVLTWSVLELQQTTYRVSCPLGTPDISRARAGSREYPGTLGATPDDKRDRGSVYIDLLSLNIALLFHEAVPHVARYLPLRVDSRTASVKLPKEVTFSKNRRLWRTTSAGGHFSGGGLPSRPATSLSKRTNAESDFTVVYV